ncbi:MAG: hypothetical protein H6993_00300 [Pseudomonadales bacterium]|nr:hypothetical protein [Pseudomonadales bacterium]MCP5182363.1 hypothetical protein [Pseudomonadales bacterium]
MSQLLIFIRTAIGVGVAVLVWLLVVQAGHLEGDTLHFAAPVLAGLVGGMTCASLSPSQGLFLAATCSVVLCLVAMAPNAAFAPWRTWSLLLIPSFLFGAAGWVFLARWLQNRFG